MPEVSFRGGLMRAETARLRTILRNSKVQLKSKLQLIQAYILSKGTFQCSTWPGLGVAAFSRFHKAILGMSRDATGNYFVPGSANDLFCDDDRLEPR